MPAWAVTLRATRVLPVRSARSDQRGPIVREVPVVLPRPALVHRRGCPVVPPRPPEVLPQPLGEGIVPDPCFVVVSIVGGREGTPWFLFVTRGERPPAVPVPQTDRGFRHCGLVDLLGGLCVRECKICNDG